MSDHHLIIIRNIIHYGSHFVLPFVFTWILLREHWKHAGLIMVMTIIIDIDHLLTTPIFDPNRCSI